MNCRKSRSAASEVRVDKARRDRFSLLAQAATPKERSILGNSRLAFLSFALMLVVGCSGSAQVKVVPVVRADFPEREPLVQDVPVDEAYYWVENDQLKIAVRYHRESLLGPAFNYDWQASLVLEGLPAGSSRLYQLKADAVRIVETAGASQRRSRTWTGVAVVEAPQAGRLKGRLHVNVRQQQFTLLNGWQPPPFQAPMMIVVARFDAIEGAKHGSRILLETESSGFQRVSNPSTRPVSQ